MGATTTAVAVAGDELLVDVVVEEVEEEDLREDEMGGEQAHLLSRDQFSAELLPKARFITRFTKCSSLS